MYYHSTEITLEARLLFVGRLHKSSAVYTMTSDGGLKDASSNTTASATTWEGNSATPTRGVSIVTFRHELLNILDLVTYDRVLMPVYSFLSSHILTPGTIPQYFKAASLCQVPAFDGSTPQAFEL